MKFTLTSYLKFILIGNRIIKARKTKTITLCWWKLHSEKQRLRCKQLFLLFWFEFKKAWEFFFSLYEVKSAWTARVRVQSRINICWLLFIYKRQKIYSILFYSFWPFASGFFYSGGNWSLVLNWQNSTESSYFWQIIIIETNSRTKFCSASVCLFFFSYNRNSLLTNIIYNKNLCKLIDRQVEYCCIVFGCFSFLYKWHVEASHYVTIITIINIILVIIKVIEFVSFSLIYLLL